MSDTSESSASSAENEVTISITQALSQCLVSSTYACGGAIKVKDQESTRANQESAFALPVTIRWDSTHSGAGGEADSTHSVEKLTIPLKSNDLDPVDGGALTMLVRDTQPASFGFKGEDIVDESYCKASKLDTSAFSTNFCPYEWGIIDIIGQALLPRQLDGLQGIRAELYKLNIYQAPSGLFKPHVDTPRSDLHFGSLVVCLPCVHKGGQLLVRHQGRSTTFDWSGNDDSIQWAAFYSDCEHEVLEVTSGHRITLTYNLFMRRGLGAMTGHCETLNLRQLPLYREMKVALANPNFMPKGGYLGKYCSHAYAHATNEGVKMLPAVLKGADMITYEVFRSLGMQAHVRPALDIHRDRNYLEEYTNEDGEEFLDSDHIGDELGAPLINYAGEEDSMGEIFDQYPHEWLKVKWLNAPTKGTENLQFAYLRYGNQAEIDFAYMFCALLFQIPSFDQRTKLAKKHEAKSE